MKTITDLSFSPTHDFPSTLSVLTFPFGKYRREQCFVIIMDAERDVLRVYGGSMLKRAS